jgi:hypothetical protein
MQIIFKFLLVTDVFDINTGIKLKVVIVPIRKNKNGIITNTSCALKLKFV